MENKKVCPKCKGEMEEGIIGDQYKIWQLYDQAAWGIKVGFLGGLKNKKKIKTYRCVKCGYLESFAQ